MRWRQHRKNAARWLWGGWAVARPLRPGQLMRCYGLGYAQAVHLIQHHTCQHARRHAWLGGIGLAALALRLACTFGDVAIPAGVGGLLLACAAPGVSLQRLLAQCAARPHILREAAMLGAQRRTARGH